jgi:predicted GNAT superfamily acetyltransferase
MSTSEGQIRICNDVSLFQQMEELQISIWGYAERDVVPSQMFVVAVKSGGEVLGAFVGDQLVGFTLAYAGIRDGHPYLHSHKAAVLPQHRDRGLGRALKLAQRENALARGIKRIEWTFDPLQGKNAYFNFCRLGVVVSRYLRNVYGSTSSPLHAGLPTDRLRADWLLDSSRVQQILEGRNPIIDPAAERVEIAALPQNTEAENLSRLQSQARERFEWLFSRGYCATWLARQNSGFTYLLERRPSLTDWPE